jgi:integrase/recombinase XerD
MIAKRVFRSTLAGDLLRYIALKQALGRCFARTSIILLRLDQFLCGPGMPSTDLTPETFQQWSQSLEPLSATTRLARMQTIRNFCIYRRRIVPDCFVPDATQFPKACPVIRPHIFSEAEVARLLGHCDVLPEDPGRSPLRWACTRLAIVLLYTAGLRRGEFIRLKLRDYDPCARTLLIQTSKFHKSRLLPLPDDVAKEVERFLTARRAAYPSALDTEPLIRSPYGPERSYTGERLYENLRILFARAGIKTAAGRLPRVHDFRHSCAVNALIRWYRAGVDVEARLPLLAAWLGHVSIFSTYHYLHFVEDLRLAANSRFMDSYGGIIVPARQKGGDD